MANTLGPVALKLEDEVLVKVRTNTTVKDLLEQLGKACKGGRIQDADGFDVTAHYSQDLPEGQCVIKQPTAGGPIDAAVHSILRQTLQFVEQCSPSSLITTTLPESPCMLLTRLA